MSRTFRHPFWKRLVLVDAEGIHEHCEGRVCVSISWAELDALSSAGVRGKQGARITLWLSPKQRGEFVECASEMWQQRHPDSWQRHKERTRRAADRLIYCWFPFLMLGPYLAFHLLSWWLGWPETLQPVLQKVQRLSAVGLICAGVFAIWYSFLDRERV